MKHITQEQFDAIEPGDTIRLRSDLKEGKLYGEAFFESYKDVNKDMLGVVWDVEVGLVLLKVQGLYYSKEMIVEVISQSKEPEAVEPQEDNQPWTEVTYFMTVEGPNGWKGDRATTFGKGLEIPALSEWAEKMRGGKQYIIVDVKILTLQR